MFGTFGPPAPPRPKGFTCDGCDTDGHTKLVEVVVDVRADARALWCEACVEKARDAGRLFLAAVREHKP